MTRARLASGGDEAEDDVAVAEPLLLVLFLAEMWVMRDRRMRFASGGGLRGFLRRAATAATGCCDGGARASIDKLH